MAIELRQSLRLSQQLIMTPQLQMAIKLLQLNRLELVDVIRQELEENPALDEETESIPEDQTQASIEEPVKENESLNESPSVSDVMDKETIHDNIDWSNYLDEYNSSGRTHFEVERKDAPQYETFIARKESLKDHLLWQLLMTSPTSEEEMIGSLIIGNLNKNGYLEISVEEISENNNLDIDKVKEALGVLQTFDPPGVCSRDLSECLLIQAKQIGLDDTLITEIIKYHIKNLENKNYKAIAKALKISINEVVASINVIKKLEPKPGRSFSVEEPQYINPDIYVYKFEDEFVIMHNDDGMPKLRINPYYKKAIGRNEVIPEKTKEYLKEKMRSATWLIRSIHQRQKTIYKVMESILSFQKDFFEKGIAFLRPMVLRDVAQDIGMHESTISRVTTNKYAYTPQGIFELKYFFNSSINRVHGEAIASASVHDKIRKIIEGENSKKPYSDDKIAKLLKEVNIDIARRTVAKYREKMGVLSSNKRKQY
ncbi:MAG: RNA polymerase factor sigma-54 [Desulfobacteraceae bacterium]|jgi:RNA polymerase sigma-54 factor|nr:RNA polymerase factor sigma-54 [Desulfobacteraceae bacterium]